MRSPTGCDSVRAPPPRAQVEHAQAEPACGHTAYRVWRVRAATPSPPSFAARPHPQPIHSPPCTLHPHLPHHAAFSCDRGGAVSLNARVAFLKLHEEAQDVQITVKTTIMQSAGMADEEEEGETQVRGRAELPTWSRSIILIVIAWCQVAVGLIITECARVHEPRLPPSLTRRPPFDTYRPPPRRTGRHAARAGCDAAAMPCHQQHPPHAPCPRQVLRDERGAELPHRRLPRAAARFRGARVHHRARQSREAGAHRLCGPAHHRRPVQARVPADWRGVGPVYDGTCPLLPSSPKDQIAARSLAGTAGTPVAERERDGL